MLYVALIFATIPVLPPAVRYLYRLNSRLVPTCVTSVYLAAGLGLVAYFLGRKRYREALSIVFFALFLAANLAMLNLIKNPVEKIHLAEYEALSIFVYRAMEKAPEGKKGLALHLGAWRFSFAVGFFDELYQGLLPNRYFTIPDLLTNGAGAALGLLLLSALMGPGRIKRCQADSALGLSTHSGQNR